MKHDPLPAGDDRPVKTYLLHYTASFQCFATIAARSPEEARKIVQDAIDEYTEDGMHHIPEIPDIDNGMIPMDALASSEPNPPLFCILQVDELD